MSSSTSEPAAGTAGAPPPGDRLFAAAFSSPAVDVATGDGAWLAAMLRVEGALARAAARVGLVPERAALDVESCCTPSSFDTDALAAGFAAEATPVIGLVRRLLELVPAGARAAVHVAATSQDVVDTAAMLVARDALGPILDDAAAVAGMLAGFAAAHRDTPQVGRSMLQHGAATTFGAACAARLVALDEARAALTRVRRERLAVQLGGAVGTLAPAGERGPALLAAFAAELGLAEPVVPWHTSRGRVAELSAALGVLAGELAATAHDVVLLSATEIAEVAVAEPGGSTAMPHKRNPARAVLAIAAAHRVPGLVATVLAGMPQELQRAAGRWQAEPATLTALLRLTGAVAHHALAAYTGLRVDVARMGSGVDALLAATGGRLDVGSAGAFVDRALAAHAGHRAHRDEEESSPRG